MKIGLGKQSFFELVKPRFNAGFSDITLADELSIIALVANEGSTTIVLLVADCESFAPSVAAEIRPKLAAALNLPVKNIALYATQNHCAPLFPLDATDQVVSLCAQAARQGIQALQPAEMIQVTVHPDPALNFCRRIVLPDLGALTFWSGYRQVEPGQADVGYLLDLTLRNIARGDAPVRHQAFPPETPIPAGNQAVLLPRATDDALQALFFRTSSGTPIGCLARFAAHPCTGEPPSRYSRYSGDFPVYLRRKLEREFGGMALFLTGPCGDANPLIERRSQVLAQSYGEQVAAELLQAINGGRWIKPDRVNACEVPVHLPIRRDFPRSLAAVKMEIAEITPQLSREASLQDNKRILDRLELLHFYRLKAFYHFTCCEEESLQPDALLTHTLPMLRLGPAVIAGLPGEPFNAYSARLREEMLGDSLIVCDQANGYVGYVPTADQVPLGGYGVNYSLFDKRAEAILFAAVKTGVQNLLA